MRYDRYTEKRVNWDNEQRAERGRISRYGYYPLIGFTPVIVLGAICIIGLVLAYFVSGKYLIMYGIALLLMLGVFVLHTYPDMLKHGNISHGYLSEEARLSLMKKNNILSLCGKVMFFASLLLSTILGIDLAGAIVLGGIILVVACYFIGKRIVEI